MGDFGTIVGREIANGEFVRQDDGFRNWITTDGTSNYPAIAGRYHLFVSLACPWAHRVIIARKIKGLESVIGMTVVDPIRDERGWKFVEDEDSTTGFKFLSEAYLITDPEYSGRVTVPVLWDCKLSEIVNNSEVDIVRMMNRKFTNLSDTTTDLYPVEYRSQIDELSAFIYNNINDGVYRAGFAQTQYAYEKAVYSVFNSLDKLENILTNRRYLCGSIITEVDWNLFVTLVRFDNVYYGHFKCNLRRIRDYQNLWGYLCDLYQLPGISETVRMDQIKQHYYVTHKQINPLSIIPLGPRDIDFSVPHSREALFSKE